MPLPERHAIPESAFVQTFRNLTGVPSYHYDAVFGRLVHEQFASARPAVVALELPASFQPALEWAAGCWPTPVAAFERGRQPTMGVVMPFVPGDSIFEAFRLASQAGIEVALIDVDVSVPGEERPPRPLALGSEFAGRLGEGFFRAAEALNRREAPLVSDLVREAAMASALATLMAQHVSVLWVGGFAHWARIVERLRCRDFSASDIAPAPQRRFTRARLGPSALMRLTGLYPSMVAAFARAPQAFEPFDAMRLLLHEAAKPESDGQAGEGKRMLPPEPVAAIDLARTGLYARNLAATARISEQPQLAELVLAASATIGPRYAARLFELAIAEHVSTPSEALDALTFEVDRRTKGSDQVEAGFRFRGRRLSAEPWCRVLRRPAIRLLQSVRAERSHPRAGTVTQGAPAMVPARPPVRPTPRAPSVLAPALAGRQSVAEVASAPGGARSSRSREARGARRGETSSGRPASAQAVGGF